MSATAGAEAVVRAGWRAPDGRTLAAPAGTAVVLWGAATHEHRASLFACGEDAGDGVAGGVPRRARAHSSAAPAASSQ